MTPKLGCVGLGNIGEPVVRHLLLAGYEVLVHDTSAEAVSRLDDTPARPVGDLKVLASAADAVLLSLPNSTVVEEVVLGRGGLVEGLSAGKILIDTSSSRPSSTRTIAKKLAEEGADMLDAPVSGGVLRAKEGTLSVMVGGRRKSSNGAPDPRGVWRQDLLRGRPRGRAPGQVTQQPALGDHPRQRRRGADPGPEGRYLP